MATTRLSQTTYDLFGHSVRGQILHRLAIFQRSSRAVYFYQRSKLKAEALGHNFNWALKMVPGIGHDHRKMGDAAARYLYEN